MSNSMDRLLQEDLDKRRLQHLYRTRVRVDSGCSDQLSVDGKLVHNFCSNDYLGLANNTVIANAFKKGIDDMKDLIRGTITVVSFSLIGHSNKIFELKSYLTFDLCPESPPACDRARAGDK